MKHVSQLFMLVFMLCGVLLAGCADKDQPVDTKVKKEENKTTEEKFEEVPVQASITADDPMEIDLKKNIDPGTVTPESVYVMDEENAKVDTKLKIDGTKLVVESKDKEKKQGTYTVFVTKKVKATDGSNIGKSLKVVFKLKEKQQESVAEKPKEQSEPKKPEPVQVKDFTSYSGTWTDSDDYCGNGIFATLQFSEKNVARIQLGAQMHGQKSRDCENAKPDGSQDETMITFDNNGIGTFSFKNIRSNVLQKGTIQLAGDKVILTTKVVAAGAYGIETYFGDNVTTKLKYRRN
ncbi:Ig-like domain-containing protein [Bacillus cytotoxicus]|uniref:Ig-like domain-containing protein n=2 Tax=Bacillus cereus group TaxID=86661 RepID=UPI001AEE4ADF|nr:Ig-like domain-containing protein [Bacillus cytotoxicus]QTR71783.1 Ig-like domain-containing protein [Bacillus cytotoxicus]HDR7313319.1 Ig-like domain-containing protein [Bacillus cytotoxicus]